MTVRIILKSKEGLCINFSNIDKIAMSNKMIVVQYTSIYGKELTRVIEKNDIRYVKVIPGKEEV